MAPKRRPPRDDDNNDDDEQDVEFDDKQLGVINRLVNAAVTGAVERKLGPKITEAVTGAMSTLQTSLLEDLRKGMGQGDASKGKPKERTDDDRQERQAPTKDPEVEALRAKVKAMEDRDKARDIEAQNAKRDDTIATHLKKIGVEPNRMRGAIAVIRDAVKPTDAGGYQMKIARDGYEEDVDVAKGIKEWAETDEGKSYRATVPPAQQRQVRAVNVIGSKREDGGGKRNEAAREQQQHDRKAHALDKLGEAVNSLTGGANIDMG